ncbi:MAG: IdeS/Mac family cysteine endopeptidase [Treponemataceae bacterium]
MKLKQIFIAFAVASAFLLLSCENDYISSLKPAHGAKVPVTGIVLVPESDSVSLVIGTTGKINAHVVPNNASNKKLIYSVNKSEIATITENGKITAKNTGNAVITIKAADRADVLRYVNLVVTPIPVPVESIDDVPEGPITLFVGDSHQLNPKAMPETATNKDFRITSSDVDKAWPTGEGDRCIIAKSAGSATIKIEALDNSGVKKEVEFIIKKLPEIKITSTTPVEATSAGGDVTFEVKTLYGKLSYEPEIIGGGKKWASFSSKDDSEQDKDTVHLNVNENKTIWQRTAYIKFKGSNSQYIKGTDGKELKVTLNQKKNENPNITVRWVDGVPGPTDMTTETEKIAIPGSVPISYHAMPHIFTWKETNSTKFFNTRKVNYTGAPDEGFPDTKHCWAKTDANMLHWWFEQNKDNIEEYITRKHIAESDKPMYKPTYTRGLPDNEEHKKSSIANVYRKNVKNFGNDILIGLKWYIYGHAGFSKTGYSPKLFVDVFNDENTPIYRTGISTKKEFEQIIKDALESEKAVAINIWGSDRSQHAITLWGAAFDDDGNIVAVYVVDNNNRENIVFPYGIWYKKDIYEEFAVDENNQSLLNPYLINYTSNSNDPNHYIGEIVTLDKGKSQWKKWLDENPNPGP